MSVEIIEVCDDYRNRKCDGKHAGDDAQRADHFAPDANRCYVAVADRRHGDDRPPEGSWDRRELSLSLADLGVVGSRAEDHHGDDEKEEEHAQFAHARLDRHAEYAQALRVFRQLEDAEDSQDADEYERPGLLRRLAVSLRVLNDEDDEVRDDRQHVEDVHDVLTERSLRGARHEAEDELYGEPGDADGLDDEERVPVVRLNLMGDAPVRGDVDADGALEGRQGLRAEVGDGDHDADYGYDGKDLGRP